MLQYNYVDVPESEALDAGGNLKPGYERWAYSYKRLDPLTPEQIAAQEAMNIAITGAVVGMNALPNWASWTPQEADTWMHNQIAGIATLTQAKAFLDLVLPNMARAICYLRDYIQIIRR